jgi:hypothetical protein
VHALELLRPMLTLHFAAPGAVPLPATPGLMLAAAAAWLASGRRRRSVRR